MNKWVLEEKQGVKYYRLEFDEVGFEKLVCLFFTRIGGLKFLLEHPDSFYRDIRWVEDNFGIKNINILKQIHSDKIYYISENTYFSIILEGDGMFADQPNIFLCVRVADCLPIYFFVPNTAIIGIVHSGWQGTLNQIGTKLAKLIKEQYKINYDQIKFSFGPAIGNCCYEIKEDVARKFEVLIKEYKIKDAILHRNNKLFLDLKLINYIMFERMGLKKAADIELCSYCNDKLLFSARRDLWCGSDFPVATIGVRKPLPLGNGTTGRNLAIIGYKI